MGIICTSFGADGKMFVVNDILNKPQRGAAMAGLDSFNRLSDILLGKLVVGDLSKLVMDDLRDISLTNKFKKMLSMSLHEVCHYLVPC